MKPIRIQKNYVKIPFEDEEGNIVAEFKFDKTDAGIKKIYENSEKLSAILDEEVTDENELDFLESAIDGTFEVGTFKKLYELNPSKMIVAIYYFQMCLGVKEELEKDAISDKQIEKYLLG